MIEEKYVLGMDCGTTNIKAVILNQEGLVIASASRLSEFIMPGPNMQEQDAMLWWQNSVAIFRELSEKAGQDVIERIKGICISSHTVTLLPLDVNGNPLRNALTYQDSRSIGELDFILEHIGYDRFVKIVGGQPSVAFLPNKLLWFKKNEPHLYSKTAYFVQASSFINFKLTGEITMDIDQASRTQCMDIGTLEWSKEIGECIGVDLNVMLPNPRLINEIIGTVTQEAAKQTGLIEGIPVVAGCSDAMASMYALGLSQLGDAGESSGTTSLVFVGSQKKSRSDIPVVTKPCAIDGMPWVFDAPIQTSGAALKWFIEKFATEEVAFAKNNNINIYTYLNELALDSSAGSNGLLFFPYLLGERAPIWDEHARGMFIGMHMDMKRSDLVRSIFEGTAFAIKHVMETVVQSGGQAKLLRICGGGAKSKTWSQIKASMLRMPVYILDEGAGDVPVGDAFIVGHKVGVFPDLLDAMSKTIKVKEVIEPIEEWAKVYDALYPYYVNMYKHLDNDLKKLRKTLDHIY